MHDGARHILLLGAGFSRNWGGWLASEAFEYLLGDNAIQAHPDLITLLWDHKRTGGFEAALAKVQQEYQQRGNTKDKLDAFQSAVQQMFDDMNEGFCCRADFEFSNSSDFSVCHFLTRFDAIFTLNQDLLLERHYMNENVALLSNQSWDGAALPGLVPPTITPITQDEWKSAKWVVKKSDYSVPKRAQPVFKLHGSSNWTQSGDAKLLVVGGGKYAAIQSNQLLRWYHEKFEEYLSQPDARLMVIGYSFSDDHINTIIQKAAGNGLKIFVIDPQGVDSAAKKRNQQISTRDPLEDSLIGASRRNLKEIFGGEDRIEYRKVLRFFDSK